MRSKISSKLICVQTVCDRHSIRAYYWACVLINDCCCCSHINSHNQVRGHRTGSSHSGAEEYPRKKHEQTKGGARIPGISQLTQFMPPPETYKSEIGSQPTMCQVRTGVYVSLHSRLEKPTIPLATQERLPRIYCTYSTYHYAYARQTQANWKKETKKRKEDKEKERKVKRAKKRKVMERKEKTRKARNFKTRGSNLRKGKEKKMSY